MQETVKKNIISALIMGFFIPVSSLLYVRKERIAIGLMSFFILAVAVLTYTPVAYFATSLWIFLVVQIIIWLYAFFVGAWQAHKGVNIQANKKDLGPWIATYILLALCIIVMYCQIPVNLYVTKSSHLVFGKNDVVITQKNPEIMYLRTLDYVTFVDAAYNENIGQIIAVPGDVLKYENGIITRNDKPYDISINLPVKSWIVPENIVLIYYSSQNLPENKEGANIDKANKEYQATILPVERIKNKALYILFSTKFFNLGKSLTNNVLP